MALHFSILDVLTFYTHYTFSHIHDQALPWPLWLVYAHQ